MSVECKKICVLPNDPLKAYKKKGEIKYGYFNPHNFFDEVHVISLFDNEVDENDVKMLAGDKILKIHKIGKANLSNYKKFEEPVQELIRRIDPLIIRSFNPRIQGWLAVKASKKLKIPIIVSLHTNYDERRDHLKKKMRFFSFLKSLYGKRAWERFVLENSDAIICVYEFIVPYAKRLGGKNIRVIYNKVSLDRFSPDVEKKFNVEKPTILSVGNLIDQKNQIYLLEAIKGMDARLILIGDGPNRAKLQKFIQKNGLEEKAELIPSVPNSELGAYYTSCNIYAQALENLGGISIPVLEAMACGLPVVISKHAADYSEIIDDAVYSVENSGNAFRDAFVEILENSKLRNGLRAKSQDIIKKIHGKNMEDAELSLYKKHMDADRLKDR